MSGVNATKRKVATNYVVADIQNLLAASVSFNQGDLLFMDTTNHIVNKLVGETDGLTFLGIASATVVSGLLPASYVTDVDASLKTPSIPGPTFGDEYEVLLKSGDTVHAGDAVYADPVSSSRGVQASGTKIIGVYTGAQGASVTGATGGTAIWCKLGARYPGDTLKF